MGLQKSVIVDLVLQLNSMHFEVVKPLNLEIQGFGYWVKVADVVGESGDKRDIVQALEVSL